PAQLHTEVASYVAQGARCDIGDQVHPNGRLDPAVYHVIGQAYRHMERLEPYLDQAVPVTEAALLASDSDLESPCNEMNYGWVKLLTESRVMFDIVERETKWEERYALVVLPEKLAVDQVMAGRLRAFIAAGGAVVATHKSGLLAGTEKSWLEPDGFHYHGASPFKPAYLVPRVNFTGDIPAYAYALYEGASQWRVEAPATTLAVLGEPLFQRSPEHYNSHAQSPFDHTTSYAALARSGRVALVAFPLGQGYYNQGFWIYRQAFQQALSQILPVPLIQTDAHLSTELSLTHQAAKPSVGRKERYLVHVVNFSPVRKTPKHTDFYEDPIPLTNVMIRLNLPLKLSTAKLLYAAQPLPVRRAAGGGVEVTVPRVDVHEVVCFELAS
ncbi:MAG TPA: beta-galactosidase trimerization domain-containing protein, partial [Candidatus Dormibacteraeota bacterium]|nr:beta-galactosidase trimerization domain-containing protein [Candidatus Dormibacteraeota bacterium]